MRSVSPRGFCSCGLSSGRTSFTSRRNRSHQYHYPEGFCCQHFSLWIDIGINDIPAPWLSIYERCYQPPYKSQCKCAAISIGNLMKINSREICDGLLQILPFLNLGGMFQPEPWRKPRFCQGLAAERRCLTHTSEQSL